MATETSDAKELLPLKQSIFQILLALGNGQIHGYGIMLELVPVSGAAEAAPHLGVADVIVDQ